MFVFRIIRRVSLLLGLSVAAAGAIAANAGWQRIEDIHAVCAHIFEEHKTELRGYHWSWAPPAWVCEFATGPNGEVVERRLPFGRR